MNQENAYSKGCEVKHLLKSKTSVDPVEFNSQWKRKACILPSSQFPCSIPLKHFMLQPHERVFSWSFQIFFFVRAVWTIFSQCLYYCSQIGYCCTPQDSPPWVSFTHGTAIVLTRPPLPVELRPYRESHVNFHSGTSGKVFNRSQMIKKSGGGESWGGCTMSYLAAGLLNYPCHC